MFGSTVLEVTIGLVFIYLLYSLLATTINELIASFRNWRAKTLEKAITRMLDDESGTVVFSKAFYDSPLIKYLAPGKGKKPSYIQAPNFSKALIDALLLTIQQVDSPVTAAGQADAGAAAQNPLVAGQNTMTTATTVAMAKEPYGLDEIQQAINKLPSGDTKTFLNTLIRDARQEKEELLKFKASLETWFDDTMERATGWYKRKTQLWLFIIGFVLAIIFNVDSIQIARNLSTHQEVRKDMVNLATAYLKNNPKLPAGGPDTTAAGYLKSAKDMINTDINKADKILGIGYGWSATECSFLFAVECFLGWLITALAISLGAPFWYDLLSKVVKINGAGNNPDDKKEKPTVATK